MDFIPIKYSPKTIDGQEDTVAVYDHVILRNRRLELCLTQQQVADKAKIQLRQYQRVESGERHISGASMRMALSICAVLKIDPYVFFPEYAEIQK